MLLGYKRNSKEEDSMFYSDVIINEAADDAPGTVLEHSYLHKWVNDSWDNLVFILLFQTEGIPLVVKDSGREILLGLVTHHLADSCSKLSNVTKLSAAVMDWVTAVVTQDTPFLSVQ